MSFDDGSLGRREPTSGDGKQRRGLLGRLRSVPRAIVRRLRRHAATWPRRHVEQQSRLYETRDEE
jgi:hypothetical protein